MRKAGVRVWARHTLAVGAGWSALALAACGNADDRSGAGGDAASQDAAAAKVAAGSGAATPLDPAAADRAAVLTAAGYREANGQWMRSCDDEGGAAARYGVGELDFRDLNGDGTSEAIVSGGGSSYCFGNTGVDFVLLRKTTAGWQVMVESAGIASFYKRQGIAWPDIEVGGPGTSCFGFLRWNGKDYVAGGTSLEGKICELAPAFDPKAAKSAAGGLPMATGLWARNQVACDAVKRGREDPAFIFDGKAMLMAQDFLSMTPFKSLGDGRYQTGTGYERQVIDMNDRKFILVIEGGTFSGGYSWCSPDQRWQPWEMSEEDFG